MRATLATVGGIAAGNLAPVPGGEAVRIALARMGGRATWHQATIAAVWDRVSEVPPIAVLSVMAAAGLGSVAVERRTAVLAAALAAAAIGFTVWRLRRSGFALAGWRERLALNRVSAPLFAAGVGYSSLLWLQDFLRLACVT